MPDSRKSPSEGPTSSAAVAHCTMRFGSTAKVLAECMLMYYRISECTVLGLPLDAHTVQWDREEQHWRFHRPCWVHTQELMHFNGTGRSSRVSFFPPGRASCMRLLHGAHALGQDRQEQQGLAPPGRAHAWRRGYFMELMHFKGEGGAGGCRTSWLYQKPSGVTWKQSMAGFLLGERTQQSSKKPGSALGWPSCSVLWPQQIAALPVSPCTCHLAQ